jgi:acyl carrier protein
MELNDIINDLRGFIRENFKVPANDPDFTDDVHLFDYGYIDSFGAVDLTTFVQSHFGVAVKDSDLIAYPLNTIRQIAEFVMKRKKGEI